MTQVKVIGKNCPINSRILREMTHRFGQSRRRTSWSSWRGSGSRPPGSESRWRESGRNISCSISYQQVPFHSSRNNSLRNFAQDSLLRSPGRVSSFQATTSQVEVGFSSPHTAPERCQPDKLATLSFSAFLVVCDQDKKLQVGQQILKGGNFCQLSSLLLHRHLSVSFTNSSWNHCFTAFSHVFDQMWPRETFPCSPISF